MFIYPQHAPAGGFPGRPRFQAHLVLETNSHFRLIDHWKRTLASGSSCIGQFWALNLVQEWATIHREELLEDWRFCRENRAPAKIEPLA
jgi:hypothetical protein